MKNNKTHDVWQSHFAKKLPKEKIDILCSESINTSESEDSLTQDLLISPQNATHDIGKKYFKSLDKIKNCKVL